MLRKYILSNINGYKRGLVNYMTLVELLRRRYYEYAVVISWIGSLLVLGWCHFNCLFWHVYANFLYAWPSPMAMSQLLIKLLSICHSPDSLHNKFVFGNISHMQRTPAATYTRPDVCLSFMKLPLSVRLACMYMLSMLVNPGFILARTEISSNFIIPWSTYSFTVSRQLKSII